EYAVTDASKHPLMAAMDTLNQRYDAEVLRMFRKLSGPGRTMPSDSLRERFGAGLDISDPFLALSIRYRIGTLDDMLRSAGRAELFIRYFAGQPILYQHPDYMEFFNSFFSRYLTHVSRKIPLGELAYRVNEEKSYASVLDLLGRDSLLRSEPIRELVLLRNLREMFYTPEFVPEAVIDILNQLKRTTRIPEHRRIAENLSYRLLQMREGNHPPALTFLTPSGDSLNVAELRGKYVYLQFWTSDCGVCAADMTAMDALHERFSADVAFIGVSMDLEPAVFQSFLKTQGHAWPLVYSGGDMELIDALNIRSFPTYLLLDREGKVLSYPARGPADQTDVAFRRLLATERTPGQ
ncbi:MAG TPA: TlpA disulfide reductase family protein, partial [Bacteroidales bacterium]|nr:TlpA disulfide reductase family protein [Bacteroidales bacterium]